MRDEGEDLRRVGRDEMNLAEYPITLLTERVPPGCKTMVFEDQHGFRGARRRPCRSVQYRPMRCALPTNEVRFYRPMRCALGPDYRPMRCALPTNEVRFGVASRTLIGLAASFPGWVLPTFQGGFYRLSRVGLAPDYRLSRDGFTDFPGMVLPTFRGWFEVGLPTFQGWFTDFPGMVRGRKWPYHWTCGFPTLKN
jgi:hypothetical protein